MLSYPAGPPGHPWATTTAAAALFGLDSFSAREHATAITVPFDLAYEFEVKALAPDVLAVLSDVPTSASQGTVACALLAQDRMTSLKDGSRR